MKWICIFLLFITACSEFATRNSTNEQYREVNVQMDPDRQSLQTTMQDKEAVIVEPENMIVMEPENDATENQAIESLSPAASTENTTLVTTTQNVESQKTAETFYVAPDTLNNIVAQDEMTNDFSIKIWLEPQKDTYLIGERFRIYVQSQKDCYIEIYNRRSDGEFIKVFPQKGMDNFVAGGEQMSFPKTRYFKVVDPPGKDRVLVLANSRNESCLSHFLPDVGNLRNEGLLTAKGFIIEEIPSGIRQTTPKAMATYEFTTLAE